MSHDDTERLKSFPALLTVVEACERSGNEQCELEHIGFRVTWCGAKDCFILGV